MTPGVPEGPGRFANEKLSGLTYSQYYSANALTKVDRPVCTVCGTAKQAPAETQRFKGLCWVCRRLAATVLREAEQDSKETKAD